MREVTTGVRPWRLGPRMRTALDVTLAGLLLAGSSSMLSIGIVPTLLSITQTAPLFLRRRFPLMTFGAVSLASAVQVLTWNFPIWGQLGFAVALYSVARFGRPVHGWIGLGTGVAGVVTASLVWTQTFNADVPAEFRDRLTLSDYVPLILLTGAIVLAAWALGIQGRVREAYEATLVERGERLAAEAEQRAVLAAADERARIAREMHDVVAHGLSVIIVQADGARYAAAHDPDVASRTLETVAGTGRESLTEMRRLLGLLRGSTDPVLAPQPTLADLPTLLADDVRDGRVVADLPDLAPEVPTGIGLTVYRLVQEALTNVRKHAGTAATATVRVREEPGALLVEVVDDGRGAATATAGHGLGLVGMRERVEVHDGSLAVGPEPGGGWVVRARIPR